MAGGRSAVSTPGTHPLRATTCIGTPSQRRPSISTIRKGDSTLAKKGQGFDSLRRGLKKEAMLPFGSGGAASPGGR
jgi:hypothetical protein